MSNKGVSRSDPTTPGLLRLIKYIVKKKFKVRRASLNTLCQNVYYLFSTFIKNKLPTVCKNYTLTWADIWK